jgi:hypothetical protein
MIGKWSEEAQLASFTTLFTNICDNDGNIKFGLGWGGAAERACSYEENNNRRGEKTDEFFLIVLNIFLLLFILSSV